MDSVRRKTQRCLDAIADAAGEGARTFTQVFASSALAEADRADARRSRGESLSILDGVIVSVKDLFDVSGHPTWAGSRILQGSPAAAADARVVARLRSAGAVIIGKTNMTEFAYSGLGLNPHFGTPANPFERRTVGRIPGGSSSGAAVALTDGMAEISLGTDTGGSVRIPSAFCGLVGWKPSASRMSLEGVWPLAPTFDSVGVLAHTVAACIEADSVIAETPAQTVEVSLSSLRLARLRGYIETELEPYVARTYEAALQRIRNAGARMHDLVIDEIERIPREQPGVTLQTYEAFCTHSRLLGQIADRYDPRVRQRLELGRSVTPESYAAAAEVRRMLQQITARTAGDYDALLLPTVPMIAPPLNAFASDESYFALNRRSLRNTSLFNFLDGCAITLPCHEPGAAPVGLSIAHVRRQDGVILAAARALESIVCQPGRAH